jgi:hypothetical protein
MENQHQHIKGYRDLFQDEIALMNEIKNKAAEVGALIEALETAAKDRGLLDGRWIAIGKTDLQKGFMALVRAVARPESF